MPLPTLQDMLFYKVYKIKDHKCILASESEMVDMYITSGFCVNLRRYLKNKLIISEKDPRTKVYAKSIEKFKIEQRRQLERHFYMIHPFSDFHFLWQTVMMCAYSIIFYFLPIFGMSSTGVKSDNSFVEKVLFVVNIICMINIFLYFSFGYYDMQAEKIILNRKSVIIHYLRTHFTFDFISTLNIHTFQLGPIFGLVEHKAFLFSRYQWIFKLFRLFTINDYCNNVQLRLNIPNYLYKPIKNALFIISIVLWLNFIIYIYDVYEGYEYSELSLDKKIFITLDNFLRRLFLCSVYKSGAFHQVDSFFAILTLHCGKFFEIWLLGKISQSLASYIMVAHRYRTLCYKIKAFIRFKDLPKRMGNRILNFFRFRFENLVVDEKAIIDTLCLSLKNEVMWHNCQTLVTKVETLRELPPTALMNLVLKIRTEIYLPNDVVVQAGEVGNEMFFVNTGILAIFTESGKEICHLSDGSHFGEIALLFNEPRVASVIAIDYCELYRLTKKDFHEAIEPYPLVKAKILKAAQDRIRETMKMLK